MKTPETETIEQHLLKLIENKNALISHYEAQIGNPKKKARKKTK